MKERKARERGRKESEKEYGGERQRPTPREGREAGEKEKTGKRELDSCRRICFIRPLPGFA